MTATSFVNQRGVFQKVVAVLQDQNGNEITLDTSGFLYADMPPMSIRVDAVDENTTYVGFAPVGSSESAAVWRIRKQVIDGTVTSTLYADGNANFDNKWTERITPITYS